MAPAVFTGGSENSSDDDDFNFESALSSRKYPVHDCCEFEDAESLKRLIFVRQEDSDDSTSSGSSSSSEEHDDESASSSEDEHKHKSISTALHSDENQTDAKISMPNGTAIQSSDNPLSKIEGKQTLGKLMDQKIIINGNTPIEKQSDTKNEPIPTPSNNALNTNVAKSNNEEIKNNSDSKITTSLEEKGQNDNVNTASKLSPKIEEQGMIISNGEESSKVMNPDNSKEAIGKAKERDKEHITKSSGTQNSDVSIGISTLMNTDTKKPPNVSKDSGSTVTPIESSLHSGNGAKENSKKVDPISNDSRPGDNSTGLASSIATVNVNTAHMSPIKDPVLPPSSVQLSLISILDEPSAEKLKNKTSLENLKRQATIEHTKESGQKKKKKRKKTKEITYYCPYDLDKRDNDENTALHVAIHFRKLECVRLLLEAGADVHKKSDGSAPVHLAVSIGAIPEHTDFAEKCLTILATYNADFALKDESLHTPLYLACMSNAPRCAQIILSDSNGLSTLNLRADRSGGRALHACAKYCTSPRRVGLGAAHAHHRVQGSRHHQHHRSIEPGLIVKVLLACPGIEVNAVNNYGQTPLHVAASRGNWVIARLLLGAGANPLVGDRRGFTPGKLAAKRGIAIPNDLESHLNTEESSDTISSQAIHTNKRDLIIDPDASTLILCHHLCGLHRSCPPIRRSTACVEPPPENLRRLQVLTDTQVGILRCGEFQSCVWENEARRAAISDVLRVHDYSYVERISQVCSSIPDHPSAISSLDPDTAVSRWSFEGAMRAAGSVCEAVDKVMGGDHRNAFCAVRPPGHHAGPRGIVTCPNDPEGSHGFCLLNNVAIGAAYARSMYRNEGIKKVAIIDFDVHHGNGTEEIIRQLVPNIQTSAIRTPYAIGSIHTSRYKPWLDEDDINNVFFASTHGYGPRELCFSDQPQSGGWFYPASGKSHTTDAIIDSASIERQNLADFISTQTWARMGDESRANCCKIINVGLALPHPHDVPGMQRIDLRDSYRKKILPYLVDFDPDMIFISAGFDGHKKDTMNFGYVGMIEDDYEWVTEQLVKVANTCCQGRIISVLEGGYKIHGGIVSPFARSVASHVRALVEGGSSRELYQKEDGIWESRFEKQMVEEKEKRRQLRIDKLREMERRRLRHVPSHFRTMGTQERIINHSHDNEIPNNLGSGSSHDIDAIMKEPLSEVVTTAPTAINEVPALHHLPPFGSASPSPFHVDSSEQQNSNLDEPLPSRKRRRNPVDYRELYEQMKKEGNFS